MDKIIYKASGIVIQDRKLLLVRAKDSEYYSCPGGKLEGDETPLQALVREFWEELRLTISMDDIKFYDRFKEPSGKNPEKVVDMSTFWVNKIIGVPIPSNEIEELKWITSEQIDHLKIGNIFSRHIIPRLILEKHID